MLKKEISFYYRGISYRGVTIKETKKAVLVDLYGFDFKQVWLSKKWLTPDREPFGGFTAIVPMWCSLEFRN